MRHRVVLQAQRARRHLNQQAMYRAHRRCDLLRTAIDDSSVEPSSPTACGEEQRIPQTVTPPPS